MYTLLVQGVVHRTGYPMSLSRKTRKAARKYGPRVDELARRRYGISGEALLDKLIQGESGDRRNAVSSKGARGKAQFMPGTRQAALRYGVDPWKGSDQAVHAAELHLEGRLTGSKGLEGYNPGGGRGYVDYILGQKIGNVSKGRGSRTGPVSQRGGSVRSNIRTDKSSRTRATFDKAGYEKALRGETLARLFSRHEGGSVLTRTGLLSGAPVNKADFQGTKTTTSRRVSLLSTNVPGSHGSNIRGDGSLPGGKIIGTPYKGTHTLGNWQSDNAIDVALRPGTPIRAVTDGVVVKAHGNPRDTGRFGGIAVTIKGKHGGIFYTHLSSSRVRAGQRVRRGQVIGGSGVANGVAHLHFGVERGDPRRYTR